MEPVPEPRLQITPMDQTSVEAVAQLERSCFSVPWSLDSLAEELSNPMAVYYTACLDGSLVGYAGMHHIIDEGYINNIAVDEAHRRSHVASMLLQTLLAYAEEHDLRRLTLEVRASNHAAIALYEGFKFKQVGLRRNYYTLPTEDAVLMTLEL